MPRVTAEQAFGPAVASPWRAVYALALVVMVFGVVTASTVVALDSRRVQFTQG